MGSIRPLVTITILVVVGAYLYVKINEGPVQPRMGANNTLNQPPDGVPPLTATRGASLATESGTPAWPSTASSVAPPTSVSATPPTAASIPPLASTNGSAPPATGTSNDSFPAVPPIPELPELPNTNVAAPQASQPAVSLPKDLPADIPSARYPDEPGQNANTNSSNDSLNPPSPLATNATDVEKTLPPLSAIQTPIAVPIAGPAASSVQGPAAISAPPQPAPSGLGTTLPASPSQASTQNPLRPSAQSAAPAAELDRYASTVPPAATQLTPVGPAPSQSIAPTSSDTSFAASWPTIQTALDRGDLKQAHQLLSKWHGNESLSPADAQRVETLLGQLAGTVIYSTEHQLEAPRVVKPGESLETIAKEYNVPSQLLAKINGIQSSEQPRPGQELKVVRGPFSAVLDLHRSEVTLTVDDRYAGKFHVTVPPGNSLTDGQWLVDQKLVGPPSTANPSAYATTPVPADRTIILRNVDNGNSPAGTPTLLIASGSTPPGLAANPPALRVSPQDAEELSDILSIGSRVTVRR